ncbi:MAG: hypothetical protein ACI85I_002574 [Arenicella sp.]|jgi:hypothetical protein
MSGGAGFITDMQNRSRRNQSMLGKRSHLSEIHEIYGEKLKPDNQLYFSENRFSEDQINEAKQRIRKQNKKDRIIQSIKFGAILISFKYQELFN